MMEETSDAKTSDGIEPLSRTVDVEEDEATVWFDVSSLAMGAAIRRGEWSYN